MNQFQNKIGENLDVKGDQQEPKLRNLHIKNVSFQQDDEEGIITKC